MIDLDDFLNTLEQLPSPPQTVYTVPANHELTDTDISDILTENGFEVPLEPEETEYQEITDSSEETEETEENISDFNEDEVPEESTQEDSIEVPSVTNNAETEDEEGGNTQESNEEVVNTPLIPPNSPTILIDESTSRFSGAEWYEEIKNQRVIIAGIGGIGSNVAFQLARMTPERMVLYDPDIVETVNMSGQLFSHSSVGTYKVEAIARMIAQYTSTRSVYSISRRFTEEDNAGPVMICGFDNMGARKTFFEKWYSFVQDSSPEYKDKCLFIDGRLSIDTIQVLCIKGTDDYNINRYKEEYLFNDTEADSTICSLKQTTYLASMIGSIIVNLFTNFVANTLEPVIPYDLPFFTEYDAQNMIFKTIK